MRLVLHVLAWLVFGSAIALVSCVALVVAFTHWKRGDPNV